MDFAPFIVALVMGIAGSLHCAGMCGAIMCVMPFQFFKGVKKATAIVLYHFGRTSVYAAMAVILHSFRDAFDPRLQQYISIALGGILLIGGILSFLPLYARFQIRLPLSGFVKNNLGRFIGESRFDFNCYSGGVEWNVTLWPGLHGHFGNVYIAIRDECCFLYVLIWYRHYSNSSKYYIIEAEDRLSAEWTDKEIGAGIRIVLWISVCS